MNEITFEALRPWIPLMTSYALKVLGALVLLVLALFISNRLNSLASKFADKRDLDSTLVKFLGNAAKYSVVCIAVVFILGVFGVQTASFAAIIAAMGFAIGLAFQGTLSSLAAGVMLLIFRPFKVGHFVKVAGEAGIVDEIGIFTTSIDTLDNRRVILPNSSIFGSTIENVSHHKTRRCDVAIGTAYEADLKKTKDVLEEVVKNSSKILDNPEAAVVLTNLGSTSIDWAIRVHVKAEDYWEVRENLLWNCKYALDKASIGIPYPQVDVHFPSMKNGLNFAKDSLPKSEAEPALQ